MRARGALLLALLLAWAVGFACDGSGSSDEPSPEGLTTATVVVADGESRSELEVEIADEPQERAPGLMFREELPEDAGMLFVFPGDTQVGFWMKDTTIPFSIAFIAAEGTILDVRDMEPLSEELTRAPGPYRYALEVNQGWFQRHGYGLGDRVEGLAGVGE
ncbi:MAG: DUF192 domain-containing protein [Dehalococcoidia bacterium]